MNIIQRTINKLFRTKTPWVPTNRTPEGYWIGQPGEVRSRELALTIPAVSKAMQLYKNGIANLPCHVYEGVKLGRMGGRKKAITRPEYRLLASKPNNLMDRTTFIKGLIDDYWWQGEAFGVARYNGLGEIIDLHRIRAEDVTKLVVDASGKSITVNERTDPQSPVTVRQYPLPGQRLIHIIREPDSYGIRGVSLLDSAAEAIGLHREILNSGKCYYQNAVRPSGWLELDGKPDPATQDQIRKNFKEVYAGSAKTGDIAALVGGSFKPAENVTAEDARILEALASSSATVAMLFNLVPSDLGDQSQSKYASVAADRQDLITRAFRPVIDTFEVAINNVLFPEGDYWCEFDTDEILRGDPEQFARVVGMGIQAGYILRSEVRDWQGLEPIPGLDTPLYPLNQGPELANKPPEQAEEANVTQEN